MTPTPEMRKMARECVAKVWKARNENAAVHFLMVGQCDDYREVQAALTAIMEASAWKPFKDAPRDGTEIDVWIGSDLGGYRVCNISFKNGFWRGVGRIEPYDFHRTPSHFMVAPDGPSATGSI